MVLTHDITLLIADDSEEMRETLKTLLTFNEKIRVVGEAADGKEAYEKVEQLKPDLVLMDINMGEVGVSDGIWATQEISLRHPQTGIIIISVQDESDYMRRAMSAGARDYLVKPFDSDELFKTIETVVERERAKWENLPASDIAPAVRSGALAQTYIVFSAKGGVGKSVITANLAVEVRKRTNKRVLIVDLDLQFGDIALLLNISPKSTLAHLAETGVDMLDAEHLETHISDSSSGVRVLAAPLKPEYAEVVTPEIISKVLEIVRTMYDYVFIDTVPSFGPEMLGALDHSDAILLVVAPDFLALKNITLGLSVLDTLNYPPDKVHLILNRTQPLTSVRLKDVERGLQRKVAIEIPSDSDLVVGSVNRGQPLMLSNPTSPVGKAISQIADLVIGNVEGGGGAEDQHASKGILGKMFGKK